MLFQYLNWDTLNKYFVSFNLVLILLTKEVSLQLFVTNPLQKNAFGISLMMAIIMGIPIHQKSLV